MTTAVGNRVASYMTATDLVSPTAEDIAKAGGGLVPMYDPITNRPAQGIPKLILIPKAWAGYFLPYCSRTKAVEYITTKLAPLTNVQELLKHVNNISINSVTVCRRGHHCINYNLIGRCSDCKCQHQHLVAKPTAEKVTKILAVLKHAVDKMLKAGPKLG